MNPFVHLPKYHVVVCTGEKCKYAVLPIHIDRHLSSPHHNYKPEQRKRVIQEVQQISELIQNGEGLRWFSFPKPGSIAIPELRAVQHDGLQCRLCSYICRTTRRIRTHCTEVHQWKNSRTKGRPSYKKRQLEPDQPWISGVHCQQFFIQGPGSQLFEVMREEHQAPERVSVTDMWVKIEKMTARRLEHIEKKTRAAIEEVDDNLEPNPWLKRVGWVRHLKGKDPERLRAAVEPANVTTEAELHVIIEGLGRVIDAAQHVAVRETVGVNALFEINRKHATQKPRMPFSSFMGDDTKGKYRGYWEQLMGYLFRMQEDETFVDVRPDYRLTSAQQSAFDKLVAAADEIADKEDVEKAQGRETPSTDPPEKDPMTKIDRLCLDLCMTLLNHELGDDEYKSVVISGMAVLGFRDDGGWLNAEDYTTKYSGVIKIARMLVLHQSYMEREDGYQRMREVTDDHQAREHAEPMFDIVRRKVRRFMTLVSDKGRPTPMDWMYECRTYSMKIRYNTTAEGVMEWEGNRVLYQQIRFNMEQLRGMVHGLVEAARRDLMGLLMLRMNDDGEVKAGQLPPIDWERLSDNAGEERIGWWFLKDVQNQFGVDGQWWLLKRVSRERELREEWFEENASTHDHPYRMEAVVAYQRQVEAFQERLLLIMHMVGGQPARATELIGMRYANTKQGGLRNIFIDRGMMVFVTTYHKNYRSSGQMKIIHRYLPREVGEILFRYLQLALPYWQAVQAVVEKADHLSPFVWSDAVQPKVDDAADQQDHAEHGEDDSGDASAEPSFRTMHRRKQWTSERMRKIMQKESERWLGVKLNISAWRHIAIGISRRYLHGKFVADEADEGVDLETFDEDNLDGDSPWDLQAGHGTHVAGMIYARELRQAPGQTMGRQDMFRQVSQEWHRFLQFTSSIQGFGVRAGMKRPRSEWEHIGREVQFRRFKQMCHVDIHGKLAEFMGEGTQFRGFQEKTMHAIMTGQSPIINVMATGEGKSMLFMLPAYCVHGGTTIVIVPLCSLQNDLERRCREARIECVQWDSRRPHETASIVLVTPESAMTKTFSTYTNRLRSTYQLDRVFMDESHVVLDSGPDFRPQLRALGAEMVRMGTQIIFLTATLPPQDEEEFFHAVQIPKECVHMFRGSTSRRNIQYQVHEVEEETTVEAISRLVAAKLVQYPAPSKIIIYGGSVEQTVEVGEALGCPIYHRSVDSRAGKVQRMKDLTEGKCRIISATNALGLGVDLPDVRVVIHAGAPPRLRDYAQESGRAGRDGQASEAIIVRRRLEHGRRSQATPSWTRSQGKDMDDFMGGWQCRRVIMDGVMDGRMERVECEEGEEACDVCWRNQEMDLPMRRAGGADVVHGSPERSAAQGTEGLFPGDVVHEDRGIGMSSQMQAAGISAKASSGGNGDQGFMVQSPMAGRFSGEGGEAQMHAQFEQRGRERQWLASEVVGQRRREGEEIMEFEKHLQRWADGCPLCRCQKRRAQGHRLEECAEADGKMVRAMVQVMTDEIGTKKRLGRFSGCYECGIPQAICQQWKQKAEEGWFERVKGVRCQYAGVLIPAVTAMWYKSDCMDDNVVRQWMIRDGVDTTSEEKAYGWFGQRVKWGGIEASNLCQVFHALAKAEVGSGLA